MIVLEDDVVKDMIDDIASLMYQYHYNPNGSDYQCAFCYECPPTNNHDIIHKDNCSGMRYLKALQKDRSVEDIVAHLRERLPGKQP